MKIVRHDPTNWFTPLIAQWPSMLDDQDEWVGTGRDLSMYETDNDVVITASVAGVPADKVDVSLENGVVTIKASHEETEEEKKKKKVVYREARKAHYMYTVTIPSPVQEGKTQAEVSDGVLTLTMPKAEEAKPKRIQVKATGK
jgi:HSP20 family protein